MIYHGGICFITERTLSSYSVVDTVRIVLDAGIRWIQLREKELPRREVYYTAEALRELTRRYDAFFVVNDYADIALAVGADGVHLGQEDLPLTEARRIMRNRTVGISTHSLNEALEAYHGGADYIGFGPIFHTFTKKDAESPKGLEALKVIVESVNIPVVAIGGIGLSNLRDVLKTGVSAVAVASAILQGDIRRNVHEFVKIIKEYETL